MRQVGKPENACIAPDVPTSGEIGNEHVAMLSPRAFFDLKSQSWNFPVEQLPAVDDVTQNHTGVACNEQGGCGFAGSKPQTVSAVGEPGKVLRAFEYQSVELFELKVFGQ